jgi:hypothetical protein
MITYDQLPNPIPLGFFEACEHAGLTISRSPDGVFASDENAALQIAKSYSEQSDSGSLLTRIEKALADMKEECGKRINISAPAFKQMNAALGQYSDEKKQSIMDVVAKFRAQNAEYEKALLACNSHAELDALLISSGTFFSHLDESGNQLKF